MTPADLVYYGLALILSAGLGLAGVLYQLHHLAVEGYHELLLADPLAAPRSPTERRHLRRSCATCSLLADMVVTRLDTAR
jgi:hypothetical protein